MMAPVRHGLPVTVQAAPAVQAAQLPLLQTMLLAADGAVRLGLLGVHAAGAAGPAGRGSDVTRVGRRTGSSGGAGGHVDSAIADARAAAAASPPPVPPRPAVPALPPPSERSGAARRPPQAIPEETRSDNGALSEYTVAHAHHTLLGSKAKTASDTTPREDRGRRPAPARRPSAPPQGCDSATTARTTRTRPPPAPRPWRSRRPTA